MVPLCPSIHCLCTPQGNMPIPMALGHRCGPAVLSPRERGPGFWSACEQVGGGVARPYRGAGWTPRTRGHWEDWTESSGTRKPQQSSSRGGEGGMEDGGRDGEKEGGTDGWTEDWKEGWREAGIDPTNKINYLSCFSRRGRAGRRDPHVGGELPTCRFNALPTHSTGCRRELPAMGGAGGAGSSLGGLPGWENPSRPPSTGARAETVPEGPRCPRSVPCPYGGGGG